MIFSLQGGAEHNIPVVISKISKEQRGKVLRELFCESLSLRKKTIVRIIDSYGTDQPGSHDQAAGDGSDSRVQVLYPPGGQGGKTVEQVAVCEPETA